MNSATPSEYRPDGNGSVERASREHAALRLRAFHVRTVLIVVSWLVDLLLGTMVAWPLALVVKDTFGAHPLGSGALFADGALDFTDFVMKRVAGMAPSLAGHVIVMAVVAAVVKMVLYGTNVAALGAMSEPSHSPPPLRALMARALTRGTGRALGTAGVSLIVAIAQAIVLAVALAAVSPVSAFFATRTNAANADRAGIVAAALLVLVALAGNVVRDVAVASHVVGGLRAFSAVKAALLTVRDAKGLLLGWAWRAALGLGAILLSGAATGLLAKEPGQAVFTIFVVHQAALAFRVGLHVSWLHQAVRSAR